jgi:hypothetical protein
VSGFRDQYDDGGPDVRVLRSAKRTARREMLCDHCGRIIAKGETYHSAAFVVDGKFETSRSHTTMGTCNVAAEPPEPNYEDLTGRSAQ